MDISNGCRNTTGLRLPLVVSAVRATSDHNGNLAIAVDVVYHPMVLRCCRESGPAFQNQVRRKAT